jgi:hypothetical protein
MSLIEELYSSKAVDLIKDLYKEDYSARESFFKAFGDKILQSRDKILLSKPLDIFLFICSTAQFASSMEESNQVAIIIYKRMQEKTPLPYILDDRGIDLAEKCFVSLSFFYPALMRRWKKGGPHPDFYRGYSKKLFEMNGYDEIVSHYELWENFLGEFFV